MVDFNSLIQLQIQIFIYMLIGFILNKLNFINASSRKSLTDLVIYIVLPANIICSFQMEMNMEILTSAILVLLVSIAIQIFCMFFAKGAFFKCTKEEQKVLSYATICSNAGFLGNPLVEGIYGAQGLLFASIYLIPQRIVMWSAGVSCFSEAKGKDVFKKVITHPCIIAVFIGVILLVTQLQLPEVVVNSLNGISRCNTFLSMVVIGGILAEIELKSVFSSLSVYYSFLRLLLIPLLVFLVCYILKLPYLVCAISSVLAGMPAGTTTAILAEKYNGDAKLAVRLIFLSTVLSLFTIPLICLMIEILL